MKLSVNDYNRMSIDEMNTLIQEITTERDKRLAQLIEEYEKKLRDVIDAAQYYGLAIYIDGERVSTDEIHTRLVCLPNKY